MFFVHLEGKTQQLLHFLGFMCCAWLEEMLGRRTRTVLCDLSVRCVCFWSGLSSALCLTAWIYCYNKHIVSPEYPLNVAFFRGTEWSEMRLCQDPDRAPSGPIPGHCIDTTRPLPRTELFYATPAEDVSSLFPFVFPESQGTLSLSLSLPWEHPEGRVAEHPLLGGLLVISGMKTAPSFSAESD